MRVLITGAAGNLGSLLSRRLLTTGHQLRLFVHNSPLPPDLERSSAEVCKADLGQPDTLPAVVREVDCIVHLAGVLFAPRPETFLPKTNVGFVRNLVVVAKHAGVRKFILVSFPHVEGETTPERRATDRMDTNPRVIHFRTRLEAERVLLELCSGTQLTPVILRSGVVYGRGVKLIEAARRLLRRRLLAVWPKPTWVHLIALPDFLNAVLAAIEKDVRGTYNICDDQPLALQEFLDALADHFGYPRPRRLPAWTFHVAGALVESLALITGLRPPLTRDIIRADMTSAVADNSRMKRELLPELTFPTLEAGLKLLRCRYATLQ